MNASLLSALVALVTATKDSVLEENPVELGEVHWLRDLAKAGVSEKPVLLLFQEVPGWQTCVQFGTQVLSHPLLVEAAETLFTPVCVYNNSKSASDVAVLERFHEPTWNNPVTRIVDGASHERDLAPRNGDGWTVAALVRQMVMALEATARPVPEWLSLLHSEACASTREVETAVFGMT